MFFFVLCVNLSQLLDDRSWALTGAAGETVKILHRPDHLTYLSWAFTVYEICIVTQSRWKHLPCLCRKVKTTTRCHVSLKRTRNFNIGQSILFQIDFLA